MEAMEHQTSSTRPNPTTRRINFLPSMRFSWNSHLLSSALNQHMELLLPKAEATDITSLHLRNNLMDILK